MEHNKLINNTVDFVKQKLANAEGGHDWWHIYRAWQLSLKIAKTENADLLVVELAALLHDIADSKFHNGNETLGAEIAKEFLIAQDVENKTIEHIVAIIDNISFKGGNFEQSFKSLELDIVQDADRLDAIGAIGIARTFNYGGFKNREIYNPNIPPVLNMNKEQYKKSVAPTLNHFYEKLLLLKDRMNTPTGKLIAKKRHDFMLLYLTHFFHEWEANDLSLNSKE